MGIKSSNFTNTVPAQIRLQKAGAVEILAFITVKGHHTNPY